MIKKSLIFTVVCLFALSGIALAGWGNLTTTADQYNFPKNFNGLRTRLVGCEIVTVTGTVASVGELLSMEIDTGEEMVTVYGIGPDLCWEANGMSKPEVGDVVDVDCCKITFSDGSVKLRAVTVVTEDGIMELVDTETGEILCPGLIATQLKARIQSRWGEEE